jgi:SAM-dependent methyltransferase
VDELPASPPPSIYDEAYYRSYCGEVPYEADAPRWRQLFEGIAARIASDIAPATVLDAGCALGLLVHALRRRGVEAWGIDVSPFAIGQVPEPARPFCRVGSILEPPSGERVDLVVCIEVVEHLPREQAEAAVASLCARGDDVLFSSSPHDYREPTHHNVEPVEGWAERFARHGFVRDVDFDASFVSPWAMRLRKRTDP